MSEERKRWRPSLGAYRSLENEVSELREQLRLQCLADGYSVKELAYLRKYKRLYEEELDAKSRFIQDCDEWREKYRSVLEERNMLDSSNRMMSCELERIRTNEKKENERVIDLEREVEYLRNRGFWARVFNR